MSCNEHQYPKSVAEAVEVLHANMGLNDEILLATMNEEDLIDAHLALGHQIRHEFGLWTGNIALLESCRIIADDKNLPIDDASMLIIKALWDKVKQSNILNDNE
jgi:hypothetical protein